MLAMTADTAYDAMAAPPILFFADEPLRAARLRRLIDGREARLVADGGLAGAAARIERQAGAGAVIIVDIARDDGPVLDDLLVRIDAGAAAARFHVILVAASACIDIVAARIADPDILVLIDPDDRQLAEAMSRALARTESLLADSGATNSRRLAELSEEVGRIARTLASLSGASLSGTSLSGANPSGGVASHGQPYNGPPRLAGGEAREAVPSDLATIRTILRLRRMREQFLEPALFADPAWDMLLDLMAAQLERRRVAVSSLCIAAAVPPTTALRWIATMTEQGLFARRPDPEDGRRVFIALSDAARTAMGRYIEAVRRTLYAPA